MISLELLLISLASFILMILQILYFLYWRRRRIKYNPSGKVEWADLSSIVKIFAVILTFLMSGTFFLLKFLDDNGSLI